MLFEYPKNIGKIKLHKWRDQVWNIIPKLIQFQKTAKVGGVGKIQNFKFGEWGYETKMKNSQNLAKKCVNIYIFEKILGISSGF